MRCAVESESLKASCLATSFRSALSSSVYPSLSLSLSLSFSFSLFLSHALTLSLFPVSFLSLSCLCLSLSLLSLSRFLVISRGNLARHLWHPLSLSLAPSLSLSGTLSPSLWHAGARSHCRHLSLSDRESRTTALSLCRHLSRERCV